MNQPCIGPALELLGWISRLEAQLVISRGKRHWFFVVACMETKNLWSLFYFQVWQAVWHQGSVEASHEHPPGAETLLLQWVWKGFHPTHPSVCTQENPQWTETLHVLNLWKDVCNCLQHEETRCNPWSRWDRASNTNWSRASSRSPVWRTCGCETFPLQSLWHEIFCTEEACDAWKERSWNTACLPSSRMLENLHLCLATGETSVDSFWWETSRVPHLSEEIHSEDACYTAYCNCSCKSW